MIEKIDVKENKIYDYLIIGLNGEVIRPRVKKTKEEQNDRIIEQQKEIVYIISWNIWQMDGIKFVIPNSCKNEEVMFAQLNLFGEEETQKVECYGCKKEILNAIKKHYVDVINGMIMKCI